MLWLVWHMWILIGLAFAGGVIAGWIIRSRSDEAPSRPMLETLDATVVAPVDRPATDIKAQPDPAPEPKPEPVPKAVSQAQASAPADDLTQIKGLGPKAAAALNDAGVTQFAQVAAWTTADVETFDALIKGRGRIVRDDWVNQAKALAKG